jgi:hypothetical protein
LLEVLVQRAQSGKPFGGKPVAARVAPEENSFAPGVSEPRHFVEDDEQMAFCGHDPLSAGALSKSGPENSGNVPTVRDERIHEAEGTVVGFDN